MCLLIPSTLCCPRPCVHHALQLATFKAVVGLMVRTEKLGARKWNDLPLLYRKLVAAAAWRKNRTYISDTITNSH